MDDPIIKLARMYRELTIGQLSQSSIDWLEKSIKNLECGAKTLDEPFGVEARTGVSNSGTRYRGLLRDQKLKNLLNYYVGKGLKTWSAVVKLSSSLKVFKTRTYPRMKASRDRLERATELECLLWEVFQLDDTPPSSNVFLYTVFRETPVFTEVENKDTTDINTIESQGE